MRIERAARLNACVLIVSSSIGIFGYHHEHGRFQITACIPAGVGLALLFTTSMKLRSERLRWWLLFAITVAFGLVVTRLAIRFVLQDCQPLRKRIYFPAMAVSSMLSCAALLAGAVRRAPASAGVQPKAGRLGSWRWRALRSCRSTRRRGDSRNLPFRR